MRALFGVAVGVAARLGAGRAAGHDNMRVLRTQEYRALQKNICQGWNTWSANSVLAHVHLPVLFDSANMKITNIAAANKYMYREYRKGWEL